jgi:hypothetical protein
VLLWHGEHDQFVPIATGAGSRRHPERRRAALTDDGHLTLATHRMPEVHAWLVERLQA